MFNKTTAFQLCVRKRKELNMKKNILTLVSMFICLAMLLSAFAACSNGSSNVTDGTGAAQTDAESESKETASSESTSDSTESNTEVSTEGDTEDTDVVGPDIPKDDNQLYLPEKEASVLPSTGDYAEIIKNADELKNGITSYFTAGDRKNYRVENSNMVLDYVLEANDSQLLSISNKNGTPYIENTMDVFVKMQDGSTYYASGSERPAVSNLYRYGYYYYDVHFYDQNFVNESKVKGSRTVPLSLFNKTVDMSEPVIEDGILKLTITNPLDPQVQGNQLKKLNAEKFNSLSITMKTEKISSVTLFVAAGEYKSYNSKQQLEFATIPDGEFHTYIITLNDGSIDDFNGDITGIRLDFNGAVGDTVEISDISALNVDNCGAPDIRMDRNLHTYTDKMYQVIRLFALKDITGIDSIGMITRIAQDTVAKLIVKDKNGTYDSIEGVDWASAEYIAFDIKDAGIFGYIMPDHAESGTMTITLEDGYYVITQTTVPAGNALSAPIPAYSNMDQVVQQFQGTSIDSYHSESEFDFGQRIYTDATHDFDSFLYEAYCERNPIPAENITINEERSPGSTYDGYDPLRGIYCFTVKENVSFSQGFYYQQNKHCPVSFKITGDDKDRNIYVLAYSFATSIECAAVLDKNDMMLPIPLEVSKNFSNEFEEPIYAWGDIRYSEVRFPMIVNADETQELTVLHLYQNWGQYPLKQLSSIQFFAPYYHLSTGCTETNCIASYYVHEKDLQTLPDHRAWSAPMWDGDPQHTYAGYHYWLQYTDADGNFYASEDKINVIEAAGPTYAEIELTYVSDDGKIKVTYNHMEMPQTDENRTYYQINYEVLEDVSFNNFSRDFSFYSVHGMGNYDHIGYLDENNKSRVVDTGKDGQETLYKLGDEFPYFDMFEISEGHNSDDYCNVSFMIYQSEFTIGGEKVDPGFVIIDKGYRVRLSLDLEEVTLKKGDKFTINAIVMPWGSQETNYNLKQPDKNVLDVRKYNLRDPLKATAIENAEVMESVFLPKIKSTNGKTAEFMISGGEGNTTFRVYGFEKLTNPKLYELITREVEQDGETTTISEWVLVDVSSSTTPDSYGTTHPYDGYAVHYDGDGTYSYSFVITMEGNAKRTFKVDASHDFEAWTEAAPIIPTTDIYFDPETLADTVVTKTGVVMTEEGRKFVRVSGNGSAGELYFTLPVTAPTTGDLLVVKYRIPTTNTVKHDLFQAYISTVSNEPSDPNYAIVRTAKQDGEWHVMVIDLSAYNMKEFVANEDGTYSTKHLRLDIINTGTANPFGVNDYIDIQYVAMCKTLEEVAEMNSSEEYVDIITGELMSNAVPVTQLGGINDADYFNLYFSADSLSRIPSITGFGKVELASDKSYVRYYGNGASPEASIYGIYAGGNTVTGKYFVLKYRLPESNVEDPNMSFIEYFTATSGEGPTGNGDRISTEADNLLIKDGEWHILILDVTSKSTMTAYQPDENGNYSAAYIRLDVFNGQVMSADSYMDIAFFAVCEDPTDYLTAIGESAEGGETEDDDQNPEAKYFNLYIPADQLAVYAQSAPFGKVELSEDNSFVSFYGDGKSGEIYFIPYSNGTKVTGQYFVLKYRFPSTNVENPDECYVEFFTSTVNSGPKGHGPESDFANTMGDNLLIKDDEWHVLVLDVTSKTTCTTYVADANGNYTAKFIRFDVFNKLMSTDSRIDVAFLAICEDPAEYLASLETVAE